MIIDVKVLRTGIVLCFVYSVVSHPRLEDKKDKTQVSGSVKTAKSNISKTKLGAHSSQSSTKDDKHKLQRGGDDLEASIEINDENIEGRIEIPDIEGELQNGGDVNNDAIDEKIYIPEENSLVPQNVDQTKDDDISGTIEMDDDNIEGTINIPDHDNDFQPQSPQNDNYVNTQLNEGGSISGSIEMDSKNIEGTINIPDDGNDFPPQSPQNNNYVNTQLNEGGSISGSIEMDSKNIEGTIKIPDDGNDFQPQSPQNDNFVDTQQNKGGSISGSIEMDSENIEGTINMPDEGWGQEDIQETPEDDGDPIGDISGKIEIDEEGNIDGDINLGGSGKNDYNDQKFPSNNYDDGRPSKISSQGTGLNNRGRNCWMKLNSKKYLSALDSLDAKYLNAREKYQNTIGPEFDKEMMEVLLISQGKAPRAIHEARGDPTIIPAGLNLGGFGMMRMAGSVLFFHRFKLRNHTKFRVDYLQANLKEMTLHAHLTLHDLHLEGAYERAITQGRDMSVMEIIPNYGELQVLLSHVTYKMEARLRMLNSKLMIELVNSRVTAKETLLSYEKSSPKVKTLMSDNIEDFVDRLKCDLDFWLKDYFNDYLMYFGIVGETNSAIQTYEKQKTIKLNEYADVAIEGIKRRIRDKGFANAKLPQFTLKTVGNQKFYLKSGVLRGLDTMYRRSVAMTKTNKGIRTIDTLIGFSNLKVEYKYEASVKPGEAALKGILILSADELSAHLALSHVKNSNFVDINVDNIVQLKTESLTVEGPANRLIADFRFVLENPIIAIMTNVLKHNIKMLKTLPRCEPRLWGEKGDQYRQYKPAYVPYNPSSSRENDQKAPIINDVETPNGEDTISDGEQGYAQDTFNDNENEFIQNEDEDRGWNDYVFSKNDSVEIEVPLNGKVEKLKLERHENFKLKKAS